MKIEIKQLRDILIIEKYENGIIPKDSSIFCGCCGGNIGKLKKNLKNPFLPEQLLDSLKNKSVEWLKLGLRHSCGHIMFPFKRSFDLITLDNYLKQ